MFRWKDYRFRYYGFRLVFFIIALSIIGVLVIGSASAGEGFDKKQAICLIVGCVIMLSASLVDYHFVLKFYWVMYLINLALLVYVKFWGDTGGGAQRWIRFGSIGLQPSELTKIFMILFLAKLYWKYENKINTFPMIAGSAVLFGIPLGLVFLQPDLSTSIVLAAIFCAVIFLANLSYKIILGVCVVVIPSASFLFYQVLQEGQQILSDYQKARILGFLYQDSDDPLITRINYQQKNSVLAIGSGQLNGKGLNNNTITSVKNGNFLSEPHTDFIFSIVGEELGFIGSVIVVILLCLIVLECLWIAFHAKDLAGRIIAGGMAAVIGFQSFINLGVVTWILPNTGLTLPFVSYGMSSLMSLLIGMGVVLNVSMQRPKSFRETLNSDDD